MRKTEFLCDLICCDCSSCVADNIVVISFNR